MAALSFKGEYLYARQDSFLANNLFVRRIDG